MVKIFSLLFHIYLFIYLEIPFQGYFICTFSNPLSELTSLLQPATVVAISFMEALTPYKYNLMQFKSTLYRIFLPTLTSCPGASLMRPHGMLINTGLVLLYVDSRNARKLPSME